MAQHGLRVSGQFFLVQYCASAPPRIPPIIGEGMRQLPQPPTGKQFWWDSLVDLHNLIKTGGVDGRCRKRHVAPLVAPSQQHRIQRLGTTRDGTVDAQASIHHLVHQKCHIIEQSITRTPRMAPASA